MKTFHPYTIHYLQLNDIDELLLLQQPCFLVFLWHDIPLGHLWLPAPNSLPLQHNKDQVIAAISPAMNYYCKNANADNNEWQPYLQNSDWNAFCNFLNDVVKTPWIDIAGAVLIDKVSVVICTRNRSEALKGCVQAILNSSDKEFELIVVDNAPEDERTKNVVSLFPSVRYIREDRKGLDIARNTGAVCAAHSIIAYTDDDVIVSKDWIKNIKLCFRNPQTSCITGQVFPLQLATEAQVVFEKYWGFNKGYVPLLFDQHYFNEHVESGVPVWDIGAGANMAFRKELFYNVGFFDERLDVGAAGCSGDSELWYRVLANGFHCRYYPHLFVFHQHRETKKQLQKQLFNYMRGHIAALMVQHEKFNHKGNILRMKRSIPRYYLNRVKDAFLQRRRDGFVFTEIRGCISGWKFYQANKK
jgi:GT2 family glycosyltransferase